MKIKRNEITQEDMKRYFTYDPGIGVLRWKIRSIEDFKNTLNPKRHWMTWNSKYSGIEAGSIYKQETNTYRSLTFKTTKYSYHRLIWLYMTGEFPEHIDHIDGNGLNNRWVNLRDVTNQENAKNSRLRSNNSSGFNGVSFHKKSGKWRARIKVDDEDIHGGLFLSLGEAIVKRKQLNVEYGFHELHGLKK